MPHSSQCIARRVFNGPVLPFPRLRTHDRVVLHLTKKEALLSSNKLPTHGKITGGPGKYFLFTHLVGTLFTDLAHAVHFPKRIIKYEDKNGILQRRPLRRTNS
jgi:hypothetical protein